MSPNTYRDNIVEQARYGVKIEKTIAEFIDSLFSEGRKEDLTQANHGRIKAAFRAYLKNYVTEFLQIVLNPTYTPHFAAIREKFIQNIKADYLAAIDKAAFIRNINDELEQIIGSISQKLQEQPGNLLQLSDVTFINLDLVHALTDLKFDLKEEVTHLKFELFNCTSHNSDLIKIQQLTEKVKQALSLANGVNEAAIDSLIAFGQELVKFYETESVEKINKEFKKSIVGELNANSNSTGIYKNAYLAFEVAVSLFMDYSSQLSDEIDNPSPDVKKKALLARDFKIGVNVLGGLTQPIAIQRSVIFSDAEIDSMKRLVKEHFDSKFTTIEPANNKVAHGKTFKSLLQSAWSKIKSTLARIGNAVAAFISTYTYSPNLGYQNTEESHKSDCGSNVQQSLTQRSPESSFTERSSAQVTEDLLEGFAGGCLFKSAGEEHRPIAEAQLCRKQSKSGKMPKLAMDNYP